MLSGYPPFYADDDQEVLEAIASGQYDFNDEVWDEVSDLAKDLIKNSLSLKKKDWLLNRHSITHGLRIIKSIMLLRVSIWII